MTQEDLLKKIGGLLDRKLKPIQEDVKTLKEEQGNTLANHGEMLAQVKTTLEAVTAGQEAQATKADIHDLRAELMKRDKAYERRIENLEEKTETPNPHKN